MIGQFHENKKRSTQLKVYTVGGGDPYRRLVEYAGWINVSTLDEADMVQFTGGADVAPDLYGDEEHPRTFFQRHRDKQDLLVYGTALAKGLPMAGICRGAQFLHVMNGGRLIQHCDNHTLEHQAKCMWMPSTILVSSTHHQMMRDDHIGEVLMWATMSTFNEVGNEQSVGSGLDLEAMYYPNTKTLSYQPHPEFGCVEGGERYKECADAYIFMINNYLLGDK